MDELRPEPGAITRLADISAYWAGAAPDRIALTAGDRSWTYCEIDTEAQQVAQGLTELGVGAGDRIAYLDRNTPEYFMHLFGGAKLNSVSVAVNWRLAPVEMEYIIDDADAKMLFVGEEFIGHLDQMTLPKVELVVVIGDPGDSGHLRYTDWVAGYDPVEPDVSIAGDDTCYQLYTSGTTGLPKGVELTNDNFMSTMAIGREAWKFDSTAVNLVAMPLFHIAGSGWALAGMVNGAHTVMTKEVDPMEIIGLIPKYGITHALLVPAVLQFVLAVPGASDADFSSMRTLVYGASPISEAVLVGSMALFGCDFAQAYGLTETTGGVVQLDPEDHDPGGERSHLLRAAGRAWGDVELRIVDVESQRDVADGQVGEVWVRSSQVMKGYWKNPGATRDAIVDGWFRTGDAGYLRDGYLYIHDRVKDMIVSGGENIYPAEIENALMRHDQIADVAVIGIPSERWGETVMALIVRSDDALDEDGVIDFARTQLAGYKVPRSVQWVDALPRNPSGKVLKTELRAPFWEGHDRQVN
ncbi:MAG: long-chain-fatty-acid--CoA ligase [Ilumatobacteraceae bacterium]|nr:long-chain-fatty-acid--CoA ligase [Ilumatobacteraceae bacterium]